MTDRRSVILGIPAAATFNAGAAVAQERSKAGAVLSSGFIYERAPYPQAHASTVVQTRGGTVAAAWFGGTRERHPDVAIWFARRLDARWEKPIRVADGVQGDGERLPTWNPVLFQPPGQDLFLFYKVGPSPREWWGMLTTSSDDGRSWTPPRRLPAGVLGPIKNKPVVLSDGAWLSPSSTEAEGDRWALHFERSTDRGRTWTATPPVPSPLRIDAIQPSILLHRDGSLQAVARARQGALATTWSRDGGRSWSALAAIELPNPNAGTDALTLADGRHLLVYNHSGHQPDTPGKGRRYPLCLALSDDGVRWRRTLTLAAEPVRDGYAYPAVIQAADGRLHITYTHDRVRIRHAVVDPARL